MATGTVHSLKGRESFSLIHQESSLYDMKTIMAGMGHLTKPCHPKDPPLMNVTMCYASEM